MPRGTEEGSEIRLDSTNLQLVANTPVNFRLYSSLSRTEDIAGDIVELPLPDDPSDPAAEPRLHAPLRAVIRFGKGGEKLIPVTLAARLSEVGTLEAWAESKISEHRWRLHFQLRKSAGELDEAAVPTVRASAVVGAELEAQALLLIEQVFGSATSSVTPEQLPAKLEQTLALGRLSWPLATIRSFADKLLSLAEGRKKNAAHEARWLNLTGFCLRPGFGFPGDDYRVEQVRRIYAAGTIFANHVQCQVEWWIFCGRLASGFNRNQQADIYQRIAPLLLPKQKQKQKQRLNPSLWREMWRTAASLELLPLQTKTQLGEALLSLLKRNEMADTCLWCLSRIGSRRLFRAPINQVLPPSTVSRWVEIILNRPHSPALLDAVVSMAQQTGDAARDLPPATLALVRRAVEASSDSGPLLRGLSGASDDNTSSRAYGEQLPEGLVAGIAE